MHNEYSISSLAQCYARVKQWINTISVFSPVVIDVDYASTFSAVKGAKIANFDTFVKSNGYKMGMIDNISATKILNPNQTIDITYTVYKNLPNEYYLIIALDKQTQRIYFTTCDSYKTSYSCFEQEHSCYARIINSFKSDTTTNYNTGRYCNVHMAYYTAVACLAVESENTELHCTYFNNCIALSTIDVTDVTRHTYNVFVGMLKKHRHYDGGNYFAGNACAYIESVDSFTCSTTRIPISRTQYARIAHFGYMSSSLHLIEDVTYADLSWHIRTGSGVSNSPFVLDPSTLGRNAAGRPKKYYFNCFDIFVRLDLDDYPQQLMFWASNVAIDMQYTTFITMYSSYSNKEVNLPTYRYILSNSTVDPGRAINQLNGISLIMPTEIFVKRQPVVLNNFSSIGTMDYVGYVSMYNCSSGSMNDIDYPTDETTGKYECLSIYRRRMTTAFENILSYESIRNGFVGYNGFAVRQFSKEVRLVDWYILSELRKNYQAREIYNSDTGIKAYQGTVEFDNVKNYYKSDVVYDIGYLPLIFDFTYFDKIKVEYTTDQGETKKEYEWNVLDLKEKIDDLAEFNLLGEGNSDVILLKRNFNYPNKYCQLSISDAFDNGIIDIIGY